MILNRLGNKSKIALEIQKYFPEHKMYIEPFFGAGGMFFNKPKARYNFLNDIDNDVYNLYRQLIDNTDNLVNEIKRVPITEIQFKEWGKGKRENSDILNAVRFLVISNFGLYGKPNTLRMGAVDPRREIINNIDITLKYLNGCYLFNCDFRDVFNKLDYKSNKEECFCYCDPPYLNTDDNYSHSFQESDLNDLIKTLTDSGIKWAISEFNNEYILKKVEELHLNIYYIGERQNLMNKRIEVLVTNYHINQLKLFDHGTVTNSPTSLQETH